MDMQTQRDGLMRLSKSDASKIFSEKFGREVHDDKLNYYAWPETFGSTAGPFHGIGGQVITSFTIEAWEYLGSAVLFCGGRLIGYREKFVPLTTRRVE